MVVDEDVLVFVRRYVINLMFLFSFEYYFVLVQGIKSVIVVDFDFVEKQIYWIDNEQQFISRFYFDGIGIVICIVLLVFIGLSVVLLIFLGIIVVLVIFLDIFVIVVVLVIFLGIIVVISDIFRYNCNSCCISDIYRYCRYQYNCFINDIFRY